MGCLLNPKPYEKIRYRDPKTGRDRHETRTIYLKNRIVSYAIHVQFAYQS